MKYLLLFFCLTVNSQIDFRLIKGLPVARLELNGKEGNFIIDTGAEYSMIDMSVRKKYKFRIWEDKYKGRGIGGGVVKIFYTNIKQLKHKESVIKIKFKSADLSNIRSQLSVIGVIGSDWLSKNVVIDFKNKVLWLRK